MIEEIVRKQREFFKAGHSLNVRGRKAALQILANTIKEYEGDIIAALNSDLGKSETESYMCEIGLVLNQIKDSQRHLRQWASVKHVCTPLAQFPSSSYIIREPYGVVLIMSPWNYPFLLCMSPLVSALAAGNTAVVKPSAYAPATSAIVKKVIEETFTEDYVAVVEGGREVNQDLLEQHFDYIFFTGSKTVGKVVMQKAAEHLTPVTLELGGKSPVIIDSQCELEIAARRVVFGKFLNVGQTCVAPDHIFVQESVIDRFQDACIKEIVAMFGSDAINNDCFGKIISEKHFRRLREIIENSRESVVFGGSSDECKLKINPTIFRLGKIEEKDENGNYSIDSKRIMQEEIFGPLMPLITYGDITDVVEYVEAHEKPLACYIFTSDKRMKQYLLRRLHFGGGCVNDTMIHLATERMPFGGVGESGMGSYHGKYGFETFTHLKSIVDKGTWLDIRMRYQPYTADRLKLIRNLM